MTPVALTEPLFKGALALAVTAIALLGAAGARRGAGAALRRRNAETEAATLIAEVARVVILLLGAIAVVAIFSTEAVAWLLGSFSVVGIVVGLSLQDILRNFFAGVWLLVERPIRVGDTIELDGRSGVVEEIAFRLTRLRAPDGRAVLVPNAILMTSTIVSRPRER